MITDNSLLDNITHYNYIYGNNGVRKDRLTSITIQII